MSFCIVIVHKGAPSGAGKARMIPRLKAVGTKINSRRGGLSFPNPFDLQEAMKSWSEELALIAYSKTARNLSNS